MNVDKDPEGYTAVSMSHLRTMLKGYRRPSLPFLVLQERTSIVRYSKSPQARPLVHPTIRYISTTPFRSNVPTWPPPPMPQGPIGPSDNLSPNSQNQQQQGHRRWYQDWMHSASFQAALTTVVGLAMVFGAGVGYLQWYKSHVLRRVSRISSTHLSEELGLM